MSKPIYYIVSVDNTELEQYIMAISFDKHILEDMIDKNYKPNDVYKFVIRENLKIYSLLRICDKENENECEKYCVMCIDCPNKIYNYKNLYAYNKIQTINNGIDCMIENCIVDLSEFDNNLYKINKIELLKDNNIISFNPILFNLYKINKIELLKDNNIISFNPILFDTYYEEGIMNA